MYLRFLQLSIIFDCKNLIYHNYLCKTTVIISFVPNSTSYLSFYRNCSLNFVLFLSFIFTNQLYKNLIYIA